MTAPEMLNQLESFYEAIHPAQENSENVYAWFSFIPHPFLNVVIRLSCSDVASKVDALIEQNEPNRSMSFWVHEENRAGGLVELLKERSFGSLDIWPAMAWSVRSEPACKADIRVADRDDFYAVLSQVYQVEKAVEREYHQMMQKIPCENYILYAEGKPVSIASLFIHGRAGEIFNDATLPGRREASQEMMRFLMHRAHTLGLDWLITLSSPEGEDLYAHLGFEKVFPIEVWAR